MWTSSEDAFFFKKYYKQLCHFAWQLLHDQDLAEDVVQDTFASYLTKKGQVFEHEIALKNFLYTSVKFNCYNVLRRDSNNIRYLSTLSEQDLCYESGIELKIIRSELMSEVHTIMHEMPNACRKIFQRGYLDGLSNKEISLELGISINTIKTQKQRGLRLLMDKLNPELLSLFIGIYIIF